MFVPWSWRKTVPREFQKTRQTNCSISAAGPVCSIPQTWCAFSCHTEVWVSKKKVKTSWFLITFDLFHLSLKIVHYPCVALFIREPFCPEGTTARKSISPLKCLYNCLRIPNAINRICVSVQFKIVCKHNRPNWFPNYEPQQ